MLCVYSTGRTTYIAVCERDVERPNLNFSVYSSWGHAKAHLCAALAQGPDSLCSIVWPWRDPACLAPCVA